MRKVSFYILAIFFCLSTAFAQTSQNMKGNTTEILRAEDARRYDSVLEKILVSDYEEKHVIRALLAAGRIGDDRAIPHIVNLLIAASPKVREMAAFALGEIESIKAADSILKVMQDTKTPDSIRAKLVEAAGKIAAANAKDEKSKLLGEAILDALETEDRKGAKQSREVILMGLTAALRAKPDETNIVAAKFLTNLDARIRADAANTLSRIRAKNANEALRAMLLSDDDPVARANAARALGAAEDKEAFNLFLEAAIEDTDSRVRVSAIRSLGSLKDAKAADKLLERGETLLKSFEKIKKPNFEPTEKSELLEIAVSLGRILENSKDDRVLKFLDDLRNSDSLRSPETEIAFARVSPSDYLDRTTEFIATSKSNDWHEYSAIYQGMSHIAGLEVNDLNKATVREINFRILKFVEGWFWSSETQKTKSDYKLAVPDLLRAMGAKKTGDSSGIFRPILDREKDVIIRATSAELLSAQPKSKENVETLIVAFAKSLETDKLENDAQLAILDALYKLDRKESVGSLLRALNAPDYLVRKKAFELLSDIELQKDFPEIVTALNLARRNLMDQLLPHDSEIIQYMSKSGTKLGQILNTDPDYKRAASSKNGAVKAVLTTEKGIFTIDLLPEDAPLTVDNFIKLAKSNYFNGLEVHRVVPNFVMQDGDPRGDGNGGPGWSIRCEVNMVPYERGAVGMALSGKDTGGSQWFVTHSPQPHLDGGYTVFGHVNETGMKVVDNIVRGDKIISVKINGDLPQRTPRKKK